MLLWIKDSPKFEEDSDEKITYCIDKIISCHRPLDNEDTLVSLQIHKHSKSCQKKKLVCRFGFPIPPMRQTTILRPLEEAEIHDDSSVKTYKKQFKKISQELNKMKDGEQISHEQLLKRLHMSEEEYILALRSSLSSPKVFLKRTPYEIRVNSYNIYCLKAWRANHDIQFVLDVYGCAMYTERHK